MANKKLGFAISLIMVVSMLLVACSKNENTLQATTSPAATAAATKAPEKDTDDMKEKVSITLMEGGWINTPTGANDPIKKWIDNKFNVDFTLQNVADFDNKALVAFSSNNPPDMILTGKNTLLKFHDQGVLLDDWTPYLNQLPSMTASFNKLSKSSVTVNGKLIGLPKAPRANNWGLMIRKDWLQNVGLSEPKNEAEFLDVLRKFTFNDPDKNGKNDTWGISSAGGGKRIGEINVLAGMYGPTGIYVTADNKVNHSILDGNYKKFLDLARTIVKEKLIDPDWYTQAWEQRKSKLYSDKIGVAYYPPMDLFAETDFATKSTVDPTKLWKPIAFPKASPEGGLRPASDINSGIITVSAKAAKDPVKWKRILKLIDSLTYPNEGYFALRMGVGVPGIDTKITDLGDGTFHYDTSQPGDKIRADNMGWIDYGTFVAVDDKTYYSSGLTDASKLRFTLDKEMTNQPSYPNIMGLLNLDPQISADLDTLQAEFEVKYILGEVADYDAFKNNWLKQGGDKLMSQAEKQLKELGLVK
ncbi:MAG: extracellular solute-binding protein [Paenibacillaceae bacterium]|nr:extracellular solute-binding protein [Paenibacillaceae bacterium]